MKLGYNGQILADNKGKAKILAQANFEEKK